MGCAAKNKVHELDDFVTSPGWKQRRETINRVRERERERERGRRPWEIERRWGKEQTLRDRDADERKQRERRGKVKGRGKRKMKKKNKQQTLRDRDADERKHLERRGKGKGKWKRKTNNPSVSFAPKEKKKKKRCINSVTLPHNWSLYVFRR